jgi:hypothetical protein
MENEILELREMKTSTSLENSNLKKKLVKMENELNRKNEE